jgi:hypothetical protein
LLSTCPNCLNQILHEDGVLQLKCECSEIFSPFLAPQSGLQPLDDNNDVAAVSPSVSDYSESEAAFAELRTFGETLNSAPAPDTHVPLTTENSAPKTAPPSTHSNPVADVSVAATAPQAGNSECMMTAGELFAGFQIETFLDPVSVWSQTTLEAEDPLRQGHQVLAQRVIQMGANGVVSVRWSFTPDGSRILITGTPVKCRKN